MSDKKAVLAKIYAAFEGNDYPGDDFLLGSSEGCEPFEEVGPFRGKEDWKCVESDFLDCHATALHFFSEAGFRFFLPAYLVADLDGQLTVAEPLFHLTYGFSDTTVEVRPQGRILTLRAGRSQFVNPRRYGAATFYDYARYRLSIFTREEAEAIVAYLTYKRESVSSIESEGIDAALTSFWLERAQNAPLAESLDHYLKEQLESLAAAQNADENS